MIKEGEFPRKKEDFPLVMSSILCNFASVKTKIRLNMKTKVLLGVLLMALPMGMMAQEDDAYFVPSKAKKKAEQEQYKRDLEERAEQQRLYYESLERLVNQIGDGDFYVEEYEGEGVPDYHIGKLRNEDEYNRRGIKNYAKVINGNDTIYYEDYEADSVDYVVDEPRKAKERGYDYYDDEMDYDYVNRLVRFHGGLASRYYWDYNYSWAYDPFYRWGWTYDPWYWDYYGPAWSYYPYSYGWGYNHYGWYAGYGYYGWHTGWYDPWYHGYYYGPGYWHGNYTSYSHRPTSSRRGNSLAGMSASRGTRNGSLAGLSGGRGSSTSRTTSSASRGTGFRTTTGTQRNDGRLTTGRTSTTTTSNRTATTTTQRSTSTSTTSRSNTTTTTSRSQSYTPTTSSSSSSRGGGFSSSSSSSSGGGFSSGGGAAGRSSGGGGGGRGGR